MQKVIRERRKNVVKSMAATPCQLQIKEKYQIPYVITEHSSWFARRLISKQQQVIIQRVAMSAKKRLAVSESLCDLLNSQFSFSYNHISNNDWGDINPGTNNQHFSLSHNF